MPNEIQALKKELARVRQQKRDYSEIIDKVKKVKDPLTQEVVRIGYSGGFFEACNLASQLLTSISWDDYPAKSFDVLVEKVHAISPELAKDLNDNGISYYVLYSDCTSASGFYADGIQIDVEEWYEDLDKDQIYELRENEEAWDQILEAKDDFANDIAEEINALLEKKGIEIDDVAALIQE